MAASALSPRGVDRSVKRPNASPFDRGRVADVEHDLAALHEQTDGIAAAMEQMAATTAQIIGTYTVDTLPSAVGRVGKYARVTDLFGVKTDLVLASQSAGVAYWQPVRPSYGGEVVSASMTFEPLKVPSALIMTGTIALGVTRSITLGTATAFPGASLDIRFTGSLLGALNVVGPGLTSAVSVLLNAYRKFVCVQTGSGFAWRQLV